MLWQTRPGTGYGDLVSPIGIAANLGVPLHFVWEDRRQPQWANDAADLIASLHEKPVAVFHHRGFKLHRRHVGAFDEHDPLHNVGFHRDAWRQDRSGIVVTTPLRNREPLPPAKRWKHPACIDWQALAAEHPQVDYRTPVDEAVETLLGAALHVSYHGSAGWLGRWCGCPQAILSDDPDGITSRSFKQAVVRREAPQDGDWAALLPLAKERLAAVREAHGGA